LDLYSEEDQCEALTAALNEVVAKDYKGKYPPDRAFERVVAEEEFFTFIWLSSFFKKKMYLKSCFHESDDLEGEDLFVFSLHEDRPHCKKGRR
jgi:hypothetical protein